jgi:hypothetical protein
MDCLAQINLVGGILRQPTRPLRLNPAKTPQSSAELPRR